MGQGSIADRTEAAGRLDQMGQVAQAARPDQTGRAALGSLGGAVERQHRSHADRVDSAAMARARGSLPVITQRTEAAAARPDRAGQGTSGESSRPGGSEAGLGDRAGADSASVAGTRPADGALEPAVPGTGDLSVFGRRGAQAQHGSSGAVSARSAGGAEGTGGGAGADGLVVSHGLLDRLAERRAALARLRRRRRLMVVGTLAVVAVVVAVVGFSPVLALRSDQITVTGSDGTVSQDQVRDALKGQVGTSLVLLNLGQVSQDVTDSLVRVRSARAVRQWPHGLRVSLSMRVPVASRQVSGGFEVLDADAVVLATEPEAPEGLVRIQAPGDEAAQAQASGSTGSAQAEDGADPAQGHGASAEQEAAASALNATQVAAVTGVIGALDPDTRAQVASGSATPAGYVTLRLTSGATVVWGDTSQGELKAMVLRVLLANQAQTYDVSSPRSPTTS